ncbi:MAG: hypothetical protein EON93_23250, partial [Burkholderiales bacterium]
MTDSGQSPGLSSMIARTLRDGGAAPAVEYRGVWHSWAQLCGLAEQLIAILAQQCPGERRVGLIVRNNPIVLSAMLGLIARGYTVVMLH